VKYWILWFCLIFAVFSLSACDVQDGGQDYFPEGLWDEIE